MPTVRGRIGNFNAWLTYGFTIGLVDCENGVPSRPFSVFKDGEVTRAEGAYPPAPNYDPIVAIALFCASNGLRVTVKTPWDLQKPYLPIDELIADC
jgi:hypothetical protein